MRYLCEGANINSRAVLFLLGPTAAGKTAASLALVSHMDAEIISVDSALVYRGMDIGTAKPDSHERAKVAHHLIDICDPEEPYSVARFCEDALAAIEDIQSRGKVAILTGGTMLYFNALEKGIAKLPDANQAIRQALEQEAAHVGWSAMHKKLAEVDACSAARIHPNDPQRLQRALEVHQITGEPLSELQKNTSPLLTTPPVKFALLPESRAWLHERIARRFKLMIEDGFLDEVAMLKSRPGVHKELPSMRSVGYRQALEHLDGQYDIDTMVEKSIVATRQLAKRQFTWIRGMDNLHPVICDQGDTEQQLSRLLEVYDNSTQSEKYSN